jgi:ATP-binding cassette subfamily F protein uup
MASPPLVTLRGAAVTFGARPVFSDLDVSLGEGDRACLVGRNGGGKSTLLKTLAGLVDLDGGSRFVQPGTRIAYLPQDPNFGDAKTIGDYVAAALPADAGATGPSIVAAQLSVVGLTPERSVEGLSGGEARRADIARALVSDAEVLLLDEPTNHLDMPTIEWLEGELTNFKGALLVISHDRAFLRKVSRQTFWLDRGTVRRLEKGYDSFEDWRDTVLEDEAKEIHKQEKKLQVEMKWMREGISARRKRNMGRVRALQDLRQNINDRVSVQGSAKLELATEQSGGSLAIEAEHISYALGDRTLVKDFSIRIQRGARIGLVGPNGVGKTTLLRLLTGHLTPDSGRVRQGVGLEPLYFDQKRDQLDPEATPWQVLCEAGGDSVTVNGTKKHVVGYLNEFLFANEQATMPVKALSGGEKNRLLLAKLFTKPSNLVILDEPTNDLDMETLDLLQEVLSDYGGTVLVVSHDRDFLDRTVTATLATNGDGVWELYAGGYSDLAAQRGEVAKAEKAKPKAAASKEDKPAGPRAKLSYKDQRERDQLPEKMAALDKEIAKLQEKLADPAFYGKDPAGFAKSSERLETAQAELAAGEERWLELEMLAEELAANK